MKNPTDVLTAKDLSVRWGISIGTLSNWRCFNQGPRSRRLPGKNPRRAVVYSVAEIERYEKAHGVPVSRKKRRP